MTTVEQAIEQARTPLLTLIRHRQGRGQSRMDAYHGVGSALGRSASWVRKVVGRAPDVQIGLHDWLNITTICARLDAASERIEAAADRIRGDHDGEGEPSPITEEARASDRPAGLGADREVAP